MNIILYANIKTTEISKRLQNVVESEVSDEQVEILRSLEDLSERVGQFPKKIDVAVILIQSKFELFELIALKSLLEGICIILILPNRKKETVSGGLSLYPRFMSFADSDFKDVSAVLEKILTQYG